MVRLQTKSAKDRESLLLLRSAARRVAASTSGLRASRARFCFRDGLLLVARCPSIACCYTESNFRRIRACSLPLILIPLLSSKVLAFGSKLSSPCTPAFGVDEDCLAWFKYVPDNGLGHQSNCPFQAYCFTFKFNPKFKGEK
jgi:hypothetical protein